MVVRKRKKITKQRGKKWHGYGSKKKHRGAGSRGGRGKAGMFKHKKILAIKTGHQFGKRGFKIPEKKRIKVINLRDLDKLTGKLGKTEIDLKQLGYQKVVSHGKLTKPITVKVEKITERAKNKIEEVGGKVIS